MTDFQQNMQQKLHGSAIPYIVYDDLAKHSFEINPSWENDALKIEELLSEIKKFKTELCHSWELTGSCKYGLNVSFIFYNNFLNLLIIVCLCPWS